jgi:hypothetical protein
MGLSPSFPNLTMRAVENLATPRATSNLHTSKNRTGDEGVEECKKEQDFLSSRTFRSALGDM